MAGTVIADRLEAASTSQLVIENGVALTPPTIADVNGVAIGTFCRAWVNFNGIGTIAIRASFNVSSITDLGAGKYTINFTNSMPDINYASLVSTSAVGGSFPSTPNINTVPNLTEVAPLVTGFTFCIAVWNNSAASYDEKYLSALVFR